MSYFFRLIRPANLLIIAATMYSLAWYFDSIFLLSDKQSYLASIDFFLLVFSTVLIAAAGNIINDYFDIKADRVNRPERIIISKHIKRRWAILLHWMINLVAFTIAIYLSYRNNTFWYVFIHLLSINLLWYYSMQLKRTLVIGNIVIALLTALVPILVGIFYNQQVHGNELTNTFPFDLFNTHQYPIYLGFSLGIFAFILNWTREIIKDIEDIKGDKMIKARTIPIIWGIRKTKGISMTLMLITIGLSFFLLAGREYIIDLMAFLPMALSALSIIVTFLLLYNAKTKSQFKRSHGWVKITMIFGLLLPLYWAIMIHYF
jgi:4-hydroxybenzoate polyprenyltransferase